MVLIWLGQLLRPLALPTDTAVCQEHCTFHGHVLAVTVSISLKYILLFTLKHD